MNIRTATPAEIVADKATDIRLGWAVRFRHFTREAYDPRTKTGVRRIEHGRAKLHVIDGVPHVRHQREMRRLTANWCDTGFGKPFVYDLRLDSPHLPGR